MRLRTHRLSLFALVALGMSARTFGATNLIANGDFATNDNSAWGFYASTGNTATDAYATGAAVVTVTESDATNYGIQLTQKGLHLDAGSTYTVTFDAKASVGRKLTVAFSTDKTWHYQGGGDVTLTTALKNYTVKITPDSTVDAGILQFNLGGTLAEITIDNVVVTGGSSTVTAGSEMILNGDFATAESNWGLNQATGNTATADYATGAAAIAITETETANWGVQLVQKGLALVAGASYVITFDASSTVARTLNVALSTDKTWHYQGGAEVSLTTVSKPFSVKITPDSSTAADGILQFNLGGTLGTVTIDNVSMKQQIVSGGTTLLPDTTTVPDAPSTLPGLRVKGRFLYTPTNEKVIFRGVNEMFVWGDKSGASLPEIAKSGANCVRIAWQLGTGTAAELDTVVSRSIRNKLIPIVEFVNATGVWDSLPVVVDAWVTKPYLDMIKRHEKYLVVNIGNEVGATVSASDYAAGYDSSVAKLRRAGIQVPLMIDASSYGQSWPIIVQTAKTLIAHDSLHNILNSVHMWWPLKYYGGSKAAVEAKIKAAIAEAVAKNIPMVVGEFGEASSPLDVTTPVVEGDSIPFRTIMSECQANQIGWLAWSWGKVHNNPQVDLDMTPDGTFAGLQTWGLEVAVTDPNSIKNTSVIPTYIVNGVANGFTPVKGRANSVNGYELRVGSGLATLFAPEAGRVEWLSLSGAVLGSVVVQAGSNAIALPKKSGLWILRAANAGREWKILAP